MGESKLTDEQARQAMKIINEECDARISERDAHGFLHYMTSDHRALEWRFCGALGFGGKIRLNSNRPHPYVDCYREHETPQRTAMIDRANQRLSMIILA